MAELELRAGLLTATPVDACGWEFTVAPDARPGEEATLVWEFGDDQSAGTLGPAATHSYAADGHRRVTVTVIAPDRPDRSAAVDIVVAGCGGSPASPPTLLVPGTLLPLLGAALGVVAIAAGVPQLWLSGGCLGLGGLVLLFGWASSSAAAVTPRPLMQTLHCLLYWIVTLVCPVLAIVTGLFWGIAPGLASAAAWGACGALFAWLGRVMAREGSERTC
jgi:hypothetical protein